ncbi:hypothetical protein ACFL0K_02765 [Patescibacteria group bacterium]
MVEPKGIKTFDEAKVEVDRLGGYPVVLVPAYSFGCDSIVILSETKLIDIIDNILSISITGEFIIQVPNLRVIKK